jgi:hypothetical protein
MIELSRNFRKEDRAKNNLYNREVKLKNKLNIDDRYIKKLYLDVQNKQAKISTPYIPLAYPPLSWKQQKGLYDSNIRINLKGEMSKYRSLVNIPDDNGFVTMFITQFMVEGVESYKPIPMDRRSIKESLNAINTHGDARGIFRFWNKATIEGQDVSNPENILKPIAQLDTLMNFLVPAVKHLPQNINKDDVNAVLGLLQTPKSFSKICTIPADFDDTFVNLALNARISNSSSRLGKIIEPKKIGFIAKNATNTLLNYSYQPFSQKRENNLIDSRTYHWLRNFIKEESDSALKNGLKPCLVLPTTWVQNSVELAENKSLKQSMPFGVNNIDGSVAANVLFGLTSAYLHDYASEIKDTRNVNESNSPNWFDAGTKKLYGDTSRMLNWIIKNDLMSQPEISREVLLYYPSVYDFYYFVARANHLLENPAVFGVQQLKDVTLVNAKNELSNGLENEATYQLLARAKTIKGKDGDITFWDDKLKYDKVDRSGKISSYSSDRLFSTAASVNALLDIWTVSLPEKIKTRNGEDTVFKREWKKNAPENVKDIIFNGARFINEITKKNNYGGESLDNIFFSGSIHAGLPMARPCNVLEDMNGTKLDPLGPFPSSKNENSRGHIHGVSGVINEAEYENMLLFTEKRGYYTPSAKMMGMDCKGASDKPFPYWSSSSMTLAMMMLALNKMRNLS